VIRLTRAIPELIRGGYDDALYKSTFTSLLYLLTVGKNCFCAYLAADSSLYEA